MMSMNKSANPISLQVNIAEEPGPSSYDTSKIFTKHIQDVLNGKRSEADMTFVVFSFRVSVFIKTIQ